jgi:CDP-diacylglycerol--glycerol-3-phosphate 3-phosphatidyltransferase
VNTSSGEQKFPALGRFWTASNVLSLLRLALAFPICWLILIRGPGDPLLLILVAIAIATDWFDGKLARWSKTVSEWGILLDPLADKVGAAMTVAALAVRGALPVWFVGLLVVRDLLVGAGWTIVSRRTGQLMMSRMPGKLSTVALACTVLSALLKADADVMFYLLWITSVLLVYSFLYYMGTFFAIVRSTPSEAQAEGTPEGSATG